MPIADTITIPVADASCAFSTNGLSAQSGPPTLRLRMWMPRNIAKLNASINHAVYACDFELKTLNYSDQSHRKNIKSVSSHQQP
eukprot:COSAG02_NODE_4816_length_4942_cov_80.857526_3_plen_84_part_00